MADNENINRLKTWLKFLLKVALSIIALYIVSKKINVLETISVIKSAQIHYLLIAVFFFVISHIISALRLNVFYAQIDVLLPTFENLKLYSKGMFYNLFLPGGIGGDAYKVYILKQNKNVTTKRLIAATLVDRASGLVALVCLTIGLLLKSSALRYVNQDYWIYLSIFLIPLAYLVFYIMLRVFFRYLLSAYKITSVYSLGKQLFQLLSAYFILKSLYIDSFYEDYLSLFLVSSVVAVAPISIGGVGLRELAFVYSYQLFEIDKNTAVAFTLLFFTITVLTSLIGAFLNVQLRNLK